MSTSGSYLRVKNWASFQHYKERHPPWIKLYNDIIGNDDAFTELDECEQWQLVRIWLIASRSSRFVIDEAGREVPVIANDAQTVQRAIQSLKKVPLEKFIRGGWLIPVAEEELTDASASASTVASTAASSLASADASALLETENQRFIKTSAFSEPLRSVG